MSRGLLIVGVIVAAGMAAAAWFVNREAGDPTKSGRGHAEETTTTVHRESVMALGRIVPGRGIIGLSGPAGERLTEVRVRTGEKVDAGEVLAVFESVPVRTAEVAAAAARLADAKEQSERIRQNGEAQAEQLVADREQLIAIHDLELESLKVRNNALQQAVEDAREVLDRLQKLSSGRTVSEREINAQSLAVKKAEAELKAGEVAQRRAAKELELLVSRG